MANGIYVATAGAVANQRQLDVVANNLANVGTAGFKGQRVSFGEVLQKQMAEDPPVELHFTQVQKAATDFGQGPLRRTGNSLDIALEGPGFVEVMQGTQVRYSRGGALTLDKAGFLVDAAGNRLVGHDNRPIQVQAEGAQLAWDRNGNLSAGTRNVGRIKVVEFANTAQLKRVGDTLFSAPPNAAQPAVKTAVRGGMFEAGNVNPVRGVSSMITASRAYEAFHRIITTFREVDSKAANMAKG
jgi:flagellar basal-body rod protein FlgF